MAMILEFLWLAASLGLILASQVGLLFIGAAAGVNEAWHGSGHIDDAEANAYARALRMPVVTATMALWAGFLLLFGWIGA